MKRSTDFDHYLCQDLREANEDSSEDWEDALRWVGLVVMYFNRLEKLLDCAICAAINDRTDAPGLLVLHGMPFAARVELYARFYDTLHGGLDASAAEYNALIHELKELGTLRNLVIHADWASTDTAGYTYVRLKINRGKLQQDYTQMTAESLAAITKRIDAAMDRIDKYLQDWRTEFPSKDP
jgi:hypothetical protein